MSEATIVNDARVMAKGQVTIPKNIRNILGITTGDRVTFVVEDGNVRVVNSAIYALQRFQAQMKGEGKAAGLINDDDVAACAPDDAHAAPAVAVAVDTGGVGDDDVARDVESRAASLVVAPCAERVVRLALTEAGEALRAQALSVPETVGACLPLSGEEAARLYELLYRILGQTDPDRK